MRPFTCSIPWEHAPVKAAAVHCSDFRFEPHFHEFLHTALRLENVDVVAVPGGPHFLSGDHALPNMERAGSKWLNFLIEHHNVTQVILIAHEDCGWYKDIEPDPEKVDNHAKGDLVSARKNLLAAFPHLDIRLFYANIEDNQVIFTAV